MSSRSTRTKAKKKAFVKAHKSSAKQRAAAATVIKHMRSARMRPGAAGVYRALLNPRVQGFLGLEKKFYDTALPAASIVTTVGLTLGIYNPTASGYPGSITVTNGIAVPSQGPGPQQRIGKSITVKSVQIKGIVSYNGGTLVDGSAPGPHNVFCALVLDTQTNGAQCTSESIFQNLGSTIYPSWVPSRNLLNSKRFKILKSETFDLTAVAFSHNANGYSVVGGVARAIDWYLPLELPVTFTDQSDEDIANVVDNSLHFVAFYNQTSGTAYVSYNARIRFLG